MSITCACCFNFNEIGKIGASNIINKQTNKQKPFACLVLVRLIFVCFESKLRLIIHTNIENINYPRIARLYIFFFCDHILMKHQKKAMNTNNDFSL